MQSELFVGRFRDGIVVRLSGRGTMRESPAFRKLVEAGLDCGPVVFDVGACEFLDSTFLGCLIGLQKRGELSGGCFTIAASREAQLKLFSLSSLHRYFDFVAEGVGGSSDLQHVDIEKIDAQTLGRHIMQCHDALADRGGLEATAFRAIAERLAKELGETPSKG